MTNTITKVENTWKEEFENTFNVKTQQAVIDFYNVNEEDLTDEDYKLLYKDTYNENITVCACDHCGAYGAYKNDGVYYHYQGCNEKRHIIIYCGSYHYICEDCFDELPYFVQVFIHYHN